MRGLETPAGLLHAEAEPASPLSFVYATEEVPDGMRDEVEIELFHASSVPDELREVLRRVMAEGLRWDQVEIVATDAGVYGPALHAMAGRLDIPVTFGVGLPVERTRAGRAVEQFFRWIGEDFPSAVIRRLLQTGTLRPPEPHRSAHTGALARRLRELRVGWGRDRYLPALDAAIERRREPLRSRRRESPDAAAERVRREREQLEALRALLAPLLSAVPEVPGRLDTDPPKVSPAALARALGSFLDRVDGRGEVERTALDRLGRILRRVEAELTRPTDFAAAVTILRDHLSIRVPAPRAEGPAPWRSNGGHLYMTDLEHGGASGRRHTFVVGMDAGRASSGAYQDPLLLDSDRRALDPGALPTSADRHQDFRFRVAALLAGLRGRVTLSYSAWDPAEARALLPSPVLLQLHRLDRRDASLGYDDLQGRLGDPVTSVPRRTPAPVDAADVWLDVLAGESGLLDATGRVREAYPGLDRGLRSRDALESGAAGGVHGLVGARPDLDPRRSGRAVSATRLESLGTCPRRYFFRYVLGLGKPRDRSPDPDVWLDALDRGALLHTVFERVLRAARERDVEPADGAFEEVAFTVLGEEAERMARDVPPPSDVVFRRQMGELREDVRAFVEMTRKDGDRWIELEFSFGMSTDDREPVELDLRNGVVRLRGAIDRIDRRPGGLQLIDYKTGSPSPYREGGAFHGGRRLQHVLYARAAERLLGESVRGLSYRFPTRRAQNEEVDYPAFRLVGGLELVERLLDAVAEGRFLPTEDAADCVFCDFRDVCHVRDAGFREVDSPLAEWGRRHYEDEVYDLLREVREWTD